MRILETVSSTNCFLRMALVRGLRSHALRTVQLTFVAYAFKTDSFCLVRLRIKRIHSCDDERDLQGHRTNSFVRYDRRNPGLLGLRYRPVSYGTPDLSNHPCI